MTQKRQVCAWCMEKGIVTVIQEGAEPTSHGICGACIPEFTGQVADATGTP